MDVTCNTIRAHNTVGERGEIVRKLRELGLSTRAIADAVGVSNKTVHEDLKRGVTWVTPAIVEGEGNDVRGSRGSGGPVVPAGDAPNSAESRAKKPVLAPAKDAPKVTGLDGKKYPAKRPEVKAASKPGVFVHSGNPIPTHHTRRVPGVLAWQSRRTTEDCPDSLVHEELDALF